MNPTIHTAWGPQAVAIASKEGKSIAVVDVFEVQFNRGHCHSKWIRCVRI